MDPFLIFVALMMSTVAVGLMIGISFIDKKIEERSRKKVFNKISEEFGLALDFQSYPSSTILIKDKPYRTFSVAGTVRNHTVFIEDTFTTPSSGRSFGYLNFVTSLPTGRGFALRNLLKKQTEMTTDGIKKIIDGTRPFHLVSPQLASYKQVKSLLDSLA